MKINVHGESEHTVGPVISVNVFNYYCIKMFFVTVEYSNIQKYTNVLS